MDGCKSVGGRDPISVSDNWMIIITQCSVFEITGPSAGLSTKLSTDYINTCKSWEKNNNQGNQQEAAQALVTAAFGVAVMTYSDSLPEHAISAPGPLQLDPLRHKHSTQDACVRAIGLSCSRHSSFATASYNVRRMGMPNPIMTTQTNRQNQCHIAAW